MRIKFFGPFHKLVGPEIHLELKSSVTLRELIHLLNVQYPALGQDWGERTDAELSAHVMFIKDGRPLKLNDLVQDVDVIQILLPVTGG